jgi:hypothetical protein
MPAFVTPEDSTVVRLWFQKMNCNVYRLDHTSDWCLFNTSFYCAHIHMFCALAGRKSSTCVLHVGAQPWLWHFGAWCCVSLVDCGHGMKLYWNRAELGPWTVRNARPQNFIRAAGDPLRLYNVPPQKVTKFKLCPLLAIHDFFFFLLILIRNVYGETN